MCNTSGYEGLTDAECNEYDKLLDIAMYDGDLTEAQNARLDELFNKVAEARLTTA